MIRRLRDVAGGGPTGALLILFGLNAVDELARTAFATLSPDIAGHFHAGITGITIVSTLAYAAALALTVPIANLADRVNRVRLILVGGLVFAVFSGGIGLAPTIVALTVLLALSQIGKAFIEPAHNSLLADWFPVQVRPRVYSFHRAGNALGGLIGPVTAGVLAARFGWRVPFLVMAVPVVVLLVLGFRLSEPVRGAQERRAHGASEEAIATEEEPPSFAEAWRMCWQIDSLRRIYRTLPFLTPAFAGFAIFGQFLYAREFGLDAQARGLVGSLVEPFQLVGLVIGSRIGMKLLLQDPAKIFRFLGRVMLGVTAGVVVFALAPNVVVAVGVQMGLAAGLALLMPGIFSALSLAIPARARSMGFAMSSVFVLPGLAAVPLVGWVGDQWGVRTGLLIMAPILLVGGLIIASAGTLVQRDIADVWATSAALSEVAHQRRVGRSKLLLCRGLEVFYGDLQVLFGVDFEVGEGEIVALLGTNGAGKSTLLKAISGVVEANKGAVVLDGRDITHAPPHEIAPRGILQIRGGAGVFPTLSVAENLRMAGWMQRRSPAEVADGIEQVYANFPGLRDRAGDPAADLSGGQQQMLALGMALITRPRLLMIDELSLGLAPVVVEQLLPIVRALRDAGTTVIVVEQSVNVALTLADEAYFMEKGQIRFHGPTADLLDRPDLLRSVFLEGATPEIETGAVVRQPLRSQFQEALKLAGLTQSFGGIRAVDDVSLTVAPGEIVGLIGPNGAGKTTLFDLVSGYSRAGSGRVFLGGRDITALGPHDRSRLGLARSFQDARLFPALTVEDTIKVALDRWAEVRDPLLAALHMPTVVDSEDQVQQWVDELIDLLGLDAYRGAFGRELSTGTRRIVDLACVVAHRPSVVLLDEPSSGIAQREAEALGPLILRLRDQLGAAVLVVEHDMPLVTGVSDRIVALDQGRVIAEGPPDEVLHHPAVVASYLGTTDDVIARSGPRASVH